MSSDSIVSIPETSYPKEVKDEPKKKKMNKFLKFILWVLGIILFIIIVYGIWTVICNYSEKKKIEEYAKTHTKKIEIDGHMMSYNIVGESNNTTIITLPGFGQYSPIIEFKPLYERLSDKYRVVVVEPFGYGYSDIIEKERTLENVISELHEFTNKLDINKYYLMAHSRGGLYSLYWANHFTNETLGYIGLDCTVPGVELLEPLENTEKEYKFNRFLSDSGLIRVASLLSKEKFLFATDLSYKNYTKEEIEIDRLIAVNNGYNDVIMNELKIIKTHLEELKNGKFPESVPVLNFVSNQYGTQWIDFHKDVIANKTHSDVVVLDGGHLLYKTHTDEVVKKIKEWAN